ncbi:MAG TPA: hypothetical protein VHZ03_44110 [Trebonia sp.]|nr:hypothetical protein [Trebonia sp.]
MKRTAFVTGGASGTGLSICQHLAPVDVRDRSQMDEAVTVARSEFGPIGILVTSAAVSRKPVGRMGTGADIAAARMYLVSACLATASDGGGRPAEELVKGD